jgi:hypothetical protein
MELSWDSWFPKRYGILKTKQAKTESNFNLNRERFMIIKLKILQSFDFKNLVIYCLLFVFMAKCYF